VSLFTNGKEGHSPQPCLREAQHKDEQFSTSPHREKTTAQKTTAQKTTAQKTTAQKTTAQNETWLVKAKESITIAPGVDKF